MAQSVPFHTGRCVPLYSYVYPYRPNHAFMVFWQLAPFTCVFAGDYTRCCGGIQWWWWWWRRSGGHGGFRTEWYAGASWQGRSSACVCMRACMCACVCICVCACLCTCMYMCMFVHLYVCAHKSVWCDCVHACGCLCRCLLVCTSVYVHVCVCAGGCACVCAFCLFLLQIKLLKRVGGRVSEQLKTFSLRTTCSWITCSSLWYRNCTTPSRKRKQCSYRETKQNELNNPVSQQVL